MQSTLTPMLYNSVWLPGRYGRYHSHALEALAPARFANGYEPRIVSVPSAGPTSLAANQVYEQRLSLYPLSLVWAISASSSAAAGCEIQIYDRGSRTRWFSAAQRHSLLTGGTTLGVTQPLYILPTPIVLIEPAMLSVTIENLAAAANTVQVLLHLAEPAWMRPGSRTPYNPNEWNRHIEQLAELARRAERTQGADGLSTPAGGATLPAIPVQDELRHNVINTAVAGDNNIVPATPDAIIDVYELFIWNVMNQQLELKDGAAKSLTGPITNFPGQSGIMLPQNDHPHFSTTKGNALVLNLSAAQQVSGYVRYKVR